MLTSYNNFYSLYSLFLANYTHLQGSYDSLSSKHNTFRRDYDSLESNYGGMKTNYDALLGELPFTRIFGYVFVGSTIILTVIMVYLVLMKLKITSKAG